MLGQREERSFLCGVGWGGVGILHALQLWDRMAGWLGKVAGGHLGLNSGSLRLALLEQHVYRSDHQAGVETFPPVSCLKPQFLYL